MSREDIYDWIIVHGCEQVQLTGINITGNCIKFINPKFPSASAYLNTPINEQKVYDYIVCQICDQLFIPTPDCAQEYAPLVKHIKDKHTKK